jgi:hypothetical protein
VQNIMPSPGKQSNAGQLSIRRLLVLLIPAAIIMVLWERYPPLREYRLYLSEDRPDGNLNWAELSADWTEVGLQRRLPDIRITCYADYTGTPNADRVCVADVNKLNGVPTMYVNFIFSKDRLLKAASAIPWWSHDPGFQDLTSRFGAPYTSQRFWHSGVRLHGWKLENGASIFYNRDRSLNPLSPNSIQWLSAENCAPGQCIN